MYLYILGAKIKLEKGMKASDYQIFKNFGIYQLFCCLLIECTSGKQGTGKSFFLAKDVPQNKQIQEEIFGD